MATLIYGFTSLNVADGNSLKEINGALLNDADMALGIYDSKKCFYQLDESSGATESLPDIVSPSLNAGTKRWILKAYLVADITANGLTASKAVFTDANKKLVSIGTLGVDQGGTGASTLTDHGVLLGSGTDPITALGAMTDGQLVIGKTGADPVLAALTEGEAIDITNAAGSITIACEDATTSNKGVTVYSGTTKALAGTDTASAMTPADVAAKVAVDVNPKAMSQGVAMTAAGSGSSGIAVGDNDNLNMGTGNFAPYFCGVIPDVTPAANIILAQKHDGTNGWILTLLTTGYLRTTINAATYDSTATLASIGVVDGANVKILSGITRETDSVAGSVQPYVNGRALGTSVAITAGAPTTVNNAVSLYVLGTSAVRTAGIANTFALFNRCPTAAEVLDLYRNGIAEADKWGSQIYTGDFSGSTDGFSGGNATVAFDQDEISDGTTSKDNCLLFTATGTNNVYVSNKTLTGVKDYTSFQFDDLWVYLPATNTTATRICVLWSGAVPVNTASDIRGTWTKFTPTLVSATNDLFLFRLLTSTGDVSGITVGDKAYIASGFILRQLGATLALEPEGIQPAPGQWLDSSSNKLHAMLPASGASLTRYKKDFEYRWTNTWTASSAAQYVGGLNKAVLSADHFITDIITQATVTTDVKNLTLGDGSDADRFVTAFAPSATRTKQTVAAQNDGTNLKLVYTPAAEATMTVETIIRGFIWEP